jgi:putative ABC transport system substrate-binding protein
MAEIARRLGVELQSIDIRGAGDLEPAFRAFERSRADGVNVVSSAMLTSFRQRLGELSVASKVPAICQWKPMVEAGCLASYGITIGEIYLISADRISKLLKGAKPADLPVQQPTRFQLVINLGIAKRLGISISPALLARADEVIEWGWVLPQLLTAGFGPDHRLLRAQNASAIGE